MSSHPDLDTLCATLLKPRVEALEALRRKASWHSFRYHLTLASSVIFFVGSPLASFLTDSIRVMYVCWALAAVGGLLAVFRYSGPAVAAYTSHKTRFKEDIVAPMVRAIWPGASYAPFQGIGRDVFDASGLFTVLGSYRSDDRVRGRVGATAFEAAEVRLRYWKDRRGRPITVFHGLFIHMAFNRAPRGRTLVQSKQRSPMVGDYENLPLVALDNPEFVAAFDVQASEDVEARNILTPAIIHRVMSLKREGDTRVSIAFVGNRAYIAIHYGRPLFEPSVWETTSRETLAQMAALFVLMELVVRELAGDTDNAAKDAKSPPLYDPDESRQDDAEIAVVIEQEFWDDDSKLPRRV